MQRRHALPVSIFALSLVGVALAQNFGPTQSAGRQVKEQLATATVQMQLRGQTLATSLIGATAYTRSGGEIGRVKDLLFNEKGRLTGMVVSIGGFFGVGGKEIAVPYELAEVVKGDDGTTTGVRIGLSKSQFEDAPAFETVNERDMAPGVTSRQPEFAPAPSETRRM